MRDGSHMLALFLAIVQVWDGSSKGDGCND